METEDPKHYLVYDETGNNGHALCGTPDYYGRCDPDIEFCGCVKCLRLFAKSRAQESADARGALWRLKRQVQQTLADLAKLAEHDKLA